MGAGVRAGRRQVLRRAVTTTVLVSVILALAPNARLASVRADTSLTAPDTSPPRLVDDSPRVPPGRHLAPHTVLALARGLPLMRELMRHHPGAFSDVYEKGAHRWQVSYFTATGRREIGQVLIDDGRMRVLEQWTGPQVAWTMARGYPGAFGEHVNALVLWTVLSLLFVAPFARWRRPLSLRNLDLLVLSLFSVSLAFFNHGNVAASVPLSYPPLVYLLVRLLIVARVGRRSGPAAPEPAPALTLPLPLVALGLVALIAFRVVLNVSDANVIDVGYAGVIGAHRLVHGQAVYGHWPADNSHGDTYGPVTYEAYVPFVGLLGWSGHWDDLPAAHLAATVFDLLALGLCFLLGHRVRGPTLGLALAYAWAAYPFTLYALASDSNDALVAVLVLLALLARSPSRRGALAALAGLTKFAPLVLAPLLASAAADERVGRSRPRSLRVFAAAFLLAAGLAAGPALLHDSVSTIYQRTFAYQANRGSPFSLWGSYGGLKGLHMAVEGASVALAIAVAFVPRRRDLVGTAAGAAAVLIALQLGLDHWFYLYIPWFFGLTMLALLGGGSGSRTTTEDGASAPARSSRLVAA